MTTALKGTLTLNTHPSVTSLGTVILSDTPL